MIKKTLRVILMIIGVLIIILLLKLIGISSAINTIKNMNPLLILVSLIPWGLAIFFSSYRLKKIITNISFYNSLKIYLSGFLLNYASFIQGVGAGAKVFMLKKRKISITQSTAGISSELIYDVLLSIAATIIFSIYHFNFIIDQLTKLPSYLIWIFICALVIFLITLLKIRTNTHIKNYFYHLKDNFKLKRIIILFPITLLSWAMTSLTILIFFKALNININIGLIFFGLTTSFLLGLISFIPGGLGVRDLSVSYIYSLAGVPLDTAVSVALFSRVYGILSVAIALIILKPFQTVIKVNNLEEHPERSKYFPYDHFKKYFNGKILEIGSAEGNNTKFLKEKYNIKDSDIYCIEIDEKKLEKAKNKVKANYYLGDARDLPFEENTFDLVYCSEVIEHMPTKEDHKKLIKEIKRVLKNGGHCIITTPNKNLYHLFCKLTGTKINPTHTSELSYKEFKKIIGDDFKKFKIIGVFGVFGGAMRFKLVRDTHSALSKIPRSCKALIAICTK